MCLIQFNIPAYAAVQLEQRLEFLLYCKYKNWMKLKIKKGNFTAL